MKHLDPLITEKPSKNSSELINPPKNALKIKGTLSHDKNFKYVEDFTPLNTAS